MTRRRILKNFVIDHISCVPPGNHPVQEGAVAVCIVDENGVHHLPNSAVQRRAAFARALDVAMKELRAEYYGRELQQRTLTHEPR